MIPTPRDRARPAGENALARRPVWLLGLLVAGLSFHAVAVLHTLVPDWGLLSRIAAAHMSDPPTREQLATVARFNEKARELPPARPLDALFRSYRILTGTRQDWQMFHQAPRAHDLEISLEARDADGGKHLLGPVLPQFQPVDLRRQGRFVLLWGRFEVWNDLAYINSYLEKVGRLLKASTDPVYQDVTLVYRKHLIQSPDEIARSGSIARIETREWWLPREAWKD